VERLSRGAKVRISSRQYQIVLMVFLSPYTLRLLLHRIMRSPPLKKQLSPPSVISNEKPEHLVVGDKAYDNDPLDIKLAVDHQVELIAPHRYNRQAPSTQDGWSLRHCYKHSRWKVERLFAWLHNFRRMALLT
jgi:hypothetical protein